MNWISVDNRLPVDQNKDYLVFTDSVLYFGRNGLMTVANYNGMGNWIDYLGENVEYDVTHWMPLPEPPNPLRLIKMEDK